MAHMNYSKSKQNKQKGGGNNLSSPDSLKICKNAQLKNLAEWDKQIYYWRTHLDRFIEEYLSTEEKPIKLFPFQQVITREMGNCKHVKDTEARSLGKTWKLALGLVGLSILYPDNRVLIISKTVRQAILTINYIESLALDNVNIKREILFPITVAKDGATVKFKNGSRIEAIAMNKDGSNVRGRRAKIVVLDEAAWLFSDVIRTVIMPVLQYKRDVYWKFQDSGFEDFDSKLIEASSAYLKSCDFYKRFTETFREINEGLEGRFICSINYKTGVRYGIIDETFVEEQKRTMSQATFDMEWMAKFVGNVDGAIFDYNLTESCRTLENVELFQPKGSKSRYILSLDVATSSATNADNASLCVIKLVPKKDNTFYKYVVYMKTFHGYKLEELTKQVRIACIRFPNIEKVIVDSNAIGEGIISLLAIPYVDDENKEHPAFVTDDMENNPGNAIPIVRAFRANNVLNSRMAMATKMFLENKSVFFPIPSANVRRDVHNENRVLKDSKEIKGEKRELLLEEFAVFMEADALQIEMGQIVGRMTASGNIVYDTKLSTQHKDRYTSLAQGLEYILGLEEKLRDEARTNAGEQCLALVMSW